MTITKEQFLEQLEVGFPKISKKIDVLLNKLDAQRVVADFGTKSMILRWHLEDGALWNVGTILVNGDLWINLLDRRAHEMGLQEFTKQFLSETAALIPGAVVRETPKETGWYVCLNGRGVKVDCLLEDEDRIQSWVDALARFQSGVKNALDARA